MQVTQLTDMSRVDRLDADACGMCAALDDLCAYHLGLGEGVMLVLEIAKSMAEPS